jgi:deazaflavin-dependent oxidoreductase (nitroreductase family)
MSGRDWRTFGRIHTKLYKALGGRFVSNLGLGRKVLLLTTTGRKSGIERTTPLVYMPVGDSMVIYASNGGKETPPAWWFNLRADPHAKIQIGRKTTSVRAREVTEEEYARIWPEAEAYNPHWRDYRKNVKRHIPLVILERVDV